jgi:hypothetical protein
LRLTYQEGSWHYWVHDPKPKGEAKMETLTTDQRDTLDTLARRLHTASLAVNALAADPVHDAVASAVLDVAWELEAAHGSGGRGHSARGSPPENPRPFLFHRSAQKSLVVTRPSAPTHNVHVRGFCQLMPQSNAAARHPLPGHRSPGFWPNTSAPRAASAHVHTASVIQAAIRSGTRTSSWTAPQPCRWMPRLVISATPRARRCVGVLSCASRGARRPRLLPSW